MKTPTMPTMTISALKERDPEGYEILHAMLTLFAKKIAPDTGLGVEGSLEGLEGLIDKGWAKVVRTGKGGSAAFNIATWDPMLGAYRIGDKVYG